MSGLGVEIGPLVDAALARALVPVLALLAERDDLPADSAVVVGAPSAAGLGRALAARALVVVPAGATEDDPFYAAVRERARAVIEVEPPAPPAQRVEDIASADPADARIAEVFALIDGIEVERITTPFAVRVVTGRDQAGVLQAREAWAGGAAVVALPGPAGDELRRTGAALVAGGTVEAAEALVLLERTPRLAMVLAARGRALLAGLPTAEGAAGVIADALRRTA